MAWAEELRILTFNIRWNNILDAANGWTYRKEAVAKVIRETADVAGLQEVTPDQRQWLQEQLSEFEFVGLGREPEDKGESVPVIFRKERFELQESGTFWLSETPGLVASKTWGNQIPRICTWVKLRERKSETSFWVYNVHLDHQSGNSRVRGIELVAERMKERSGGEPAILVGDFNATVGEGPISALLKRENPALTSTFDALNVPAEGTFHGFTGATKTRAIDFIFFEKKRWSVKSGSVVKATYKGTDGVDRFVSDHFPVEAVLVRSPEGK